MDFMTQAPETKQGQVRFTGPKYVFIREEQSRRDVFAHNSEILDGEQLQVGDQVEFLAIQEMGGPHKGKLRAIEVRKLA